MNTALSVRTSTAATTPPMIGPRFVPGPEEVRVVLFGVDNVDNLQFRQYIGDPSAKITIRRATYNNCTSSGARLGTTTVVVYEVIKLVTSGGHLRCGFSSRTRASYQ